MLACSSPVPRLFLAKSYKEDASSVVHLSLFMINSERSQRDPSLWRQSLGMHRVNFPKYHRRTLRGLERDWQVFAGIKKDT